MEERIINFLENQDGMTEEELTQERFMLMCEILEKVGHYIELASLVAENKKEAGF